MTEYWFHKWMERHDVSDARTLRRALAKSLAVGDLLSSSPERILHNRTTAPVEAELVGGKGIDLTGYLGCRHIDCLSKEIDGLFRHAWHYFDLISLPDQAVERIASFEGHGEIEQLASELEAFVLVIAKLQRARALDLVRFDVRMPPCHDHFRQHAVNAGIDQAFDNAGPLAKDLARSATMSWAPNTQEGHAHLDFTVQSPQFEHTEWGTLCSAKQDLPATDAAIRAAVADAVVKKYLAGLSADAMAAKLARAPFGATVPYYRTLLRTSAKSTVGDVAFELSFPVSTGLTTEAIVALRKEESAAFRRLQHALRDAILARLNVSESEDSTMIAAEIKHDVIEPALLNIADALKRSRRMAARTAAGGIGLGAIAATVGLLIPVAAPIATGLAVGGAITLGAQALKKANDDELAAIREIQLSDMYFLWKGHLH